MKSLPTVRARRRRVGTAAAAFAHASLLLDDRALVERVVISSLRKGAHSRIAVLAHARHQTAQNAEPDLTSLHNEAIAADTRTLARQLAATRPLLERSIVDLELRYGLDRGSFARVLGVDPDRAAEHSRSIAFLWNETLDPALMATLGTGSCDQLCEVLFERGALVSQDAVDPETTSPAVVAAVQTVGEALELAPAVLAHSRQCETCAQRLKSLTSVRSLVGQIPVEPVPSVISSAARAARRRLPSALPPSIEPRRIDIPRLRVPAVAVAVLALLSLGGYGAVDAVAKSDSQDERVEKLVKAPPMSSLDVSPAVINSAINSSMLANNGSQTILWNANVSAPWLTVQPSSGRLEPGQRVALVFSYAVPVEERIGGAAITVEASAGLAQTLRYDTAG